MHTTKLNNGPSTHLTKRSSRTNPIQSAQAMIEQGRRGATEAAGRTRLGEPKRRKQQQEPASETRGKQLMAEETAAAQRVQAGSQRGAGTNK